jgi:hypothetical protein
LSIDFALNPNPLQAGFPDVTANLVTRPCF